VKRKGPYTLALESAQNTFTLGESCTNSILAWGFSLPQICTLCLWFHTDGMWLHYWRQGMSQVSHLPTEFEVLAESHSSHFIPFWKCMQQLQLEKPELKSYRGLSILWLLGFQISCWLFRLTCVDFEQMLFWFDPLVGQSELLLLKMQPLFRTLPYQYVIGFLSGRASPNIVQNQFWIVVTDFLMKPKTTLHSLLLSCHFRVTAVTVLLWPVSELPDVGEKLEVLLEMYQVTSLL